MEGLSSTTVISVASTTFDIANLVLRTALFVGQEASLDRPLKIGRKESALKKEKLMFVIIRRLNKVDEQH